MMKAHYQELLEIVEYADCEFRDEPEEDGLNDVDWREAHWVVTGYNMEGDEVEIDPRKHRKAAVTRSNLMGGEGEAHKAKIEAEYEIDLSPYSTLYNK